MRKLLAIILCVIMLISLASCGKTEPPVSEDQTTENTPVTDTETENKPEEPTAAEIYEKAADKIRALDTVSLEVSLLREQKVGSDLFEEGTEETILLKNMNSEDFCASVESVTLWSSLAGYDITKVYQNGTLFMQNFGTDFAAEVTAEEFMAGIIPAVILDSSLYGKVEEMSDGNISFEEPVGIESWVSDYVTEFIDSSGVAQFNRNGDLVGSTYTVTYIQGAAEIKDEFTVSITQPQSDIVIEAPADQAECITLSDPDALEILNRASCIWTVSESLDVFYTDTFFTEAGAALMSQMNEISLHGSGADIKGKYKYDVYVQDYTYGETTEYAQEEEFIDGKYWFSADGSEPESQEGIFGQDFRAYCIESAAYSLPIVENFETLEISDLGSMYLLEYTYENEFGTTIEDDVCNNLFADPAFLDSLAESYRTETAGGYMGVDKYTGLPTAVNLTYEGYHTIEGTEYLLNFESSKSIYPASLSAYTNITDKPYSSGEELQQPTPLFYHVTGEDGQEMWLFGTIHVGDERTANLPSEIRTAFDASDAFALELDADAFADQMDYDPEFAEQVLNAYIYTDGSTTKDHISDAQLYEDAEKMLKASGQFSSTALLMKANMWATSIDNFVMQQGYEFCSEYGIETILEHWAEESDKELIEVESAYDQIVMLTDFSDELQEQLLAESVYVDFAESNADLRELFELWCSGDEATLIEYLKPDTSDLTAEELELYNEYVSALETVRNAKMHDVAVDYLESGDVIFYAVGLAHLIAEDGLVNTLRDSGYTVELVTYN